MKLGFLGTGRVGGTLAEALARKNHEVLRASRQGEPSFAQVVEKSDLLFLATPWPAALELMGSLPGLAGKIIVDCTNPLLEGKEDKAPLSGVERLQALAPQARFVKAFNTVGFNIMADPLLEGRRAVMTYCGDDPQAKSQVRSLIEDVGFEPFDLGPLSHGRLLEAQALLWILAAMKLGHGRDFAFGLLRR